MLLLDKVEQEIKYLTRTVDASLNRPNEYASRACERRELLEEIAAYIRKSEQEKCLQKN